MKLTKVARAVLTDSLALVVTFALSLIVLNTQHLPLAIRLIQVLGLALLLSWPVATLRHDTHKHKVRDTHQRQVVFEILAFGLVAASLAYLNYSWFFVRHGLSAAYLDTTSNLYMEATSVTLLTLLLCQTVHLVFVRNDHEKRLSHTFLRGNQELHRAWAVSAFILLNLLYNPLLQVVFKTAGLDFWDWLSALLMASLYTGLKVIQRHSREHTHHAVLKLHHELGKKL